MKRKNNKLIETILGPSGQFSLPNQIFNAITFSGFLISLLLFCADIVIDLSRGQHNSGFGVIVTISYLWMYGKSRESGDYADYTVFYIALEFFLILQSWFMQGGISGVSLLVALHFIITIPMILSGKKQYFIITMVFLLITILFIGEFTLPGLVRQYKHVNDLLIDIYITLLLMGTGIIVCISLVMRNHELQFERIKQFNLSLDLSKKALEQKMIEQKEARATIQKALEEKELLLREIHHRVKNNLQVISSMLILQQYKQQNQKTIEAFSAAGNRVQSIALVHELLYQSETIASIEFESYINKLIRHLFDMYLKEKRVTFKIGAGHTVLAIEDAIPCGLIVNELISNSLKYAFPGNTPGTIGIYLSHMDENRYQLIVSDNGIGLDRDIDWDSTTTLGLTLVRELVEGQLEGNLELEAGQGTTWTITWNSVKTA